MLGVKVGIALLVAGGAYAQLSLDGARCGRLTCAPGEYCSSDTNRCTPCDDVCNKTHHNYDAGLCVKECQDYIHDLKFVARTDGGGTPNADFKSVQLQARAALIISSVLLALVVLIILFKCWSFTRNNRNKLTWKFLRQKLQPSKNRVKQYPSDLTHHNPHAEMAKVPNADLKLELRSSHPEPPKRHQQPLNVLDLEANRNSQTDKSQGAQTPKTISTSLSNRHPAEDRTLDYSYDNMGMNVTPPPVQPTPVNNF